MLYPSINVLRTKADSKYTLVSLAAKRSRDIIDGKPTLVQLDINKPVSIATREIAEDLITYSRDFTTEEEAESLAEGHELGEVMDMQADLSEASAEYEAADFGDAVYPEGEYADEESSEGDVAENDINEAADGELE